MENKKNNFFYTKQGRLVEFPIYTKQYWMYILARTLAFITDYIIVIILQTIVFQMLGGGLKVFLLSATIGFVYFLLYNTITMFIMEGQTIGMKIAKVRAMHALGNESSRTLNFIRASIASLYAVPLIGWAMMLTNIVSSLFFKGFTMVDYCSRTIVVTMATFQKLLNNDIYIMKKGVK